MTRKVIRDVWLTTFDADKSSQHQKNLFDVRLFTSEESLRKFLIGQGTELLITGERDWELCRGINHGLHR